MQSKSSQILEKNVQCGLYTFAEEAKHRFGLEEGIHREQDRRGAIPQERRQSRGAHGFCELGK